MFTIDKITLIQQVNAQIILDSSKKKFPHIISTDSRKNCKNKIFIAFKGKKFNAHQYLQEAIIKKTICLIISEDIDENILKKATQNHTLILKVKNTKIAYFLLSSLFLKNFPYIKIIGITGSVGKTSLCQFLAQILEQYFPKKILATQDNTNNIIGISHNIHRLKKNTQFLILELGTNSQGEIPLYTEHIRFDYAFLTHIGSAHIGNFNSIQDIAKEKIVLIEQAKFSFIAQETYPFIQKFLTHKNYWMIGNTSSCQLQYSLKSASLEKNTFLLKWYNKEENFVQIFQAAHYLPLLLTLCAGLIEKLQINKNLFLSFIPKIKTLPNRMQIIKKGDNTHILDSYNASLTSFSKALYYLKNLNHTKLILIFADMEELGTQSTKIHQELKQLLQKIQLPYKKLFLLGKQMQKTFPQDKQHIHIQHKKEIFSHINNTQDTLFYYKGARKYSLETILQEE